MAEDARWSRPGEAVAATPTTTTPYSEPPQRLNPRPVSGKEPTRVLWEGEGYVVEWRLSLDQGDEVTLTDPNSGVGFTITADLFDALTAAMGHVRPTQGY